MRRIAAMATMAVGTLTLVGALAAPASAVPDPVGTVDCLAQAAGDVTSLIDPASPGLPAEVPGTACLAP
ncbi:hypothetical protein ABT390_01290 [Streptomyces aurantiacus]|uniref:Secreted protein n=1 Tax=Streptomyces aurantiacus JA 4570 TaxID=1286094 RepID=S4AKB2_9ACTN|nr:hypothetical protein [Streptomyces aurantiacus]EPH41897.1 hypothetical protein STRAU_5064 [Streptomyces aurantiacus JA 4570]